MSNRSWTAKALVLSLSEFGEGHRNAWLLTEEKGIVQAAVFGGSKSKLKGLVSPWHTGTMWIYSDPVKNNHKITDFDVLFWRQGIRENLVRSLCASVCTELVTRSHGVADWVLVNAFLDGISVSGEEECRRALLRFLWRILLSAGINPDIEECTQCGRPVHGTIGINAVLYYSPHNDACICHSCVRYTEMQFPLSFESREYLSAIATERPATVRAINVSEKTTVELRQFLFFLVKKMVGYSLKSLDTAEGIL
ncbi:MAG TPA: DNA repair protein RecO [Treponemataceae bacterium]|nr:DNA repair protein RecO [Treponemataceae bacterium]